MALVVQKYGGATVATLEKIKLVAKKVIKEKKRGNEVVVVVSAMGGETDRLEKLAYEFSKKPSLREYDILLASGEQVSCALLTLAIQSMGERAVSLLGYQIPIRTDDLFAKAIIENVESQKIQNYLNQDYIVVVAGFQGINKDGDITTLGRGGSDISAVAIAAVLNADSCQLFKEVPGVFTADPGIVSDAARIPKISYDEMLEFSSMGAKIVHSRAVELARKFKIPLEIKSSFEDGEGTMINANLTKLEDSKVVAVTCDKKEAKISIANIPNDPGITHKIFKSISDSKISVDMIAQSISRNNLTDITFTVPKTDRLKTVGILKDLFKGEPDVEVFSNPSIAKVSVVGDALRIQYGTAAKIFNAFAKEGIRIYTITTSQAKMSCAISEKYAELAVRALHEEFGLGNAKKGKAPKRKIARLRRTQGGGESSSRT